MDKSIYDKINTTNNGEKINQLKVQLQVNGLQNVLHLLIT